MTKNEAKAVEKQLSGYVKALNSYEQTCRKYERAYQDLSGEMLSLWLTINTVRMTASNFSHVEPADVLRAVQAQLDFVCDYLGKKHEEIRPWLERPNEEGKNE